MSLTLAQYQRRLMEWRQKYGVPPPPKTFGLKVQTSTACFKKGCGSLKRTQRHHKGNDFWFANLLPDIFAPRYLQFHPDDVAYLCEHHHKAVHKLYKKLMADVWTELRDGGQSIITEEWCRKWIENFRAAYEKWAKYPARKRKRKRSLGAKHKRTK